MKKARIYIISEKPGLKPELDGKSIYKAELVNLDISGLGKIQPDKNDINVVVIALATEALEKHKQEVLKTFDNFTFSQIIIITANTSSEFQVNDSRYLVLPNDTKNNIINVLLDRAILTAYYKMTAFEIGESCLSNIGFFEGIFELAKKEQLDAYAENKALQSLLQYETGVKQFQDNLNNAFEKLLKIKDTEILEMKKRLEASEKLDKLREKEIRDALDSAEAIERVLQYTRVEEMNMEKTIQAQNQLFEYTSQQIQDLIEENKKLKAELEKKN